ncbi:MAG: signal peptidase I [Planctomycetes bacterium]|nr:signal peptidase I [Planctomycetota bacterium]MBL7107061.1 signal peptidase I [Phycisphaerae bacterium]
MKEKKKAGFKKNRVAEFANTFEWLITAFILAFVFRAFVMEAYRIPTGSMADTLRGDHFRLGCPQCGYRYDYGFVPESFGLRTTRVPAKLDRYYPSRCPNCGYYQKTGGNMPVSNGDRILVLKCIYQFFEPKQWDVLVFKNPTDPSINYIKRLIGRPGEKLEIIDGDVYINDRISRKPAKVQNELWMPIYDNDYQPVNPMAGSFNGHLWAQPFDLANSKWKKDQKDNTAFTLDIAPETPDFLRYDTKLGNDFKAAYAYNSVGEYSKRPLCSDLMVRYYLEKRSEFGLAGASLSKYGTEYRAWVEFSGKMVIAKIDDGQEIEVLASKKIDIPDSDKLKLVKFANVDHVLTLEFDKQKLSYDLGRGSDDAGTRKSDIEPEAKIFASGRVKFNHVAIFRDIHYTHIDAPGPARASESNPIYLKKDQFFVLGDNSPNSADSRWWSSEGKGNNNKTYEKGIVPREYLMGKALFVYWPGGFKPLKSFRFAIIPNFADMKLIYGGSGK